ARRGYVCSDSAPPPGARPPPATRGSVARSHVLVARASFHGRVVEERFFRTDAPIEIGSGSALTLPLPEGHDYLARIPWRAAATAEVKDATGEIHLLAPERSVVVRLDPIRLELSLVDPVWLPRMGQISIASSLTWFAVVLMVSTLGVQLAWA